MHIGQWVRQGGEVGVITAVSTALANVAWYRPARPGRSASFYSGLMIMRALVAAEPPPEALADWLILQFLA